MGVHVCNTSTGKQKHGNETFILGQPKLGMRPPVQKQAQPHILAMVLGYKEG